MNLNRRIIAAVAMAALLGYSVASSQLFRSTTKVGTTVAQFLKIGAGARSLGMGGSAVALDGDVYSVYWNPGSLARITSSGEATFTHANWLADVSYDFAAAALSIEGFGTLALSITSLAVPEDIVRTEDNPEGDGRRWSASDVALGISYGRALTDRFAIGATFKYIREAIWNESAQGVAFDIGTIYTTQFNDMKIGASISNFGTQLRLDGTDISFNNFPGGQLGQGPQNVSSNYKTDSYDIPLSFRIGLSMDAAKTDRIRATVAVDATHPNDNTEYVNSGLELAFQEMFFGRIGYKALFLQDSEQGLTWGAGFRYEMSATTSLKVDYAFADYGRLKNVQYLTLSIGY
jgi:Type IX secretion system protein PorV